MERSRRVLRLWAGCLLLSVLLGIEGFTTHIRSRNTRTSAEGSVIVRSIADAFTGNVDSINSSRAIGSIEDVGVDQESKAYVRRFWRNLNPFKGRERIPGTLILVRHGDSVIRDELTFTGWIDVDLSEEGVLQVKNAARLIASEGYTIDLVYTSRLKRAIRSAWILMQELNQIYKPVYKSWRLNERMYGALEGLSKPILSSELGEETVRRWRTSLFARPPPMTQDHKHWHFNERKYADLETDQIPTGESLNDTMVRTIPLLNSRILPLIEDGQNVLICAHGNSLRGIVKHIDNLSSDQIQNVKLPNGIPLVYKFEREKNTGLLKPVRADNKASDVFISGEFLEKKKGKLEEAIQILDAREAELRVAINRQVESLTMSVIDYANDSVVPANSSLRSTQLSGIKPSVLPLPKSNRKSSIQSPYIVITRHGKTTNNILGQFTGWQDAPLSPQGKEEATEVRSTEFSSSIVMEPFNLIYIRMILNSGREASESAWYGV
jgi:2,3-bisphosphoglycerate-dependent phosphoglycerate mutase